MLSGPGRHPLPLAQQGSSSPAFLPPPGKPRQAGSLAPSSRAVSQQGPAQA